MLSPAAAARQSQAICRTLLDLVDGYKTIMTYVSKRPEVETRDLIAILIERGKRVVVPIIERETRSLRLSYIKDLSVLVPSTFGVPEPIGNEVPASPTEIEVAIIPMIAFDSRGNRLGYGAGYYDRFLSQHSHMIRIGVAFSCQQAEHIPADSNDVKMDYIVTEKGIIRCI